MSNTSATRLHATLNYHRPTYHLLAANKTTSKNKCNTKKSVSLEREKNSKDISGKYGKETGPKAEKRKTE